MPKKYTTVAPLGTIFVSRFMLIHNQYHDVTAFTVWAEKLEDIPRAVVETMKALEEKAVRSQDVTLSGMSSRLGMKSGQKLRGHFVRVFYQGRLVFEEANPPAMKAVAENYLAGK